MSLFCWKVTTLPCYWELEKQTLFKAVFLVSPQCGVRGWCWGGPRRSSRRRNTDQWVQPCTRQDRPTAPASSWAWWALEGGEHRSVPGWFCMGGAGRSLPKGLSPLPTVRMGPASPFLLPFCPWGPASSPWSAWTAAISSWSHSTVASAPCLAGKWCSAFCLSLPSHRFPLCTLSLGLPRWLCSKESAC